MYLVCTTKLFASLGPSPRLCSRISGGTEGMDPALAGNVAVIKSPMHRYLNSMKTVSVAAAIVLAILLTLLHLRRQNGHGSHSSALQTQSAVSGPGNKTPQTGNDIPCLANAADAVTAKSPTATATPVQPHYVDLSWKASASPGVVKYNVHRCTPGSPCSALTSVIASVPGTSYTDRQVQPSQTYCYFVTAVASTPRPYSGTSNIVHVVIPSP